jgi:hypothetical protein
MLLAYLLLLTGLTISAVAIYYSVVGLAAIFSAAVIPIIVMGSALEVAKLVCASWLKANWSRAPRLMKFYMTTAVAVLMLITSMGIFGFLSKAHSDQSLVSGDVIAKISVYDEKIKTAKDNIDANRKALKQMDESVDQSMARSNDEKGADKAVALRRSQAKERARLQSEIQAEQKTISQLNDEAAPIRAEVRKVEAEVGPLKYIAAFVYGATDESVLERAVTWVIITIIVVFDPLAVIMLLAAQMTFAWHNKNKDPLAEEEPLLHDTVPHTELEIHPDEGPDPEVEEFFAKGKEVARALDKGDPLPYPYTYIEEVYEPDYPDVTDKEEQVESDLDKWNKMIAEAEAEVAKTGAYETITDRIARGETYVDSTGAEAEYEADDGPLTEDQIEQITESVEQPAADFPDLERPGDYLTPPEEDLKKKTYMVKDSTGKTQVKSHE